MESNCYFDRWTKRQKEFWFKKGYLEIKDNSLNLNLKIDKIYLEDIQNPEYNLINSINSVKMQYFLLRCKQDMTVKKEEFELLKKYNFLIILNSIYS
jgi:hypothetical protein